MYLESLIIKTYGRSLFFCFPQFDSSITQTHVRGCKHKLDATPTCFWGYRNNNACMQPLARRGEHRKSVCVVIGMRLNLLADRFTSVPMQSSTASPVYVDILCKSQPLTCFWHHRSKFSDSVAATGVAAGRRLVLLVFY